MKKQEIIEQLIDKILSGEATPEQEKEVQDYFEQDQLYLEWDNSIMGKKLGIQESLKEKIGQRLHRVPNDNISRGIYRQFLKVAAAILLICLPAWYIHTLKQGKIIGPELAKQEILPASDKGSLILSSGDRIDLETIVAGEQIQHHSFLVSRNNDGELSYTFENKDGIAEDDLRFNILSTPRGGRLTIVLADGSKVWLNSDSKLEFPNSFSSKTREVKVSGEAYFEVAKNDKQPFIVHTDKSQIKVLGTQFNVNAYENESDNITTLIEGSIALSTEGGLRRIKPGQQAIVSSTKKLRVQPADVEAITAWKENNFVFKNQNIKAIMNEISRWYDVEVEYEGNMQDKNFDIFISRRKDISEILSLIEVTETVRFEVEGRRVLVIE